MIKEKYVRPAILADALELAPKMKAEDRAEILASNNASPLKALVEPFTYEKGKIYSIIGTKDEVYEADNVPEEKEDQIGQPKYQMMDYAKLTPLLVKAVQEQQTIIDDLKSRIETLEG